MYTVGKKYSRNDIFNLLEIPESKRGGDWMNGYHRHESDYYIFCNIGVPGRTGHNYSNSWDGQKLIWYGKTNSHFEQKSIQNLISDKYRALIFYRNGNREPFTFAGIGRPIPHPYTRHPARIDWTFHQDETLNS